MLGRGQLVGGNQHYETLDLPPQRAVTGSVSSSLDCYRSQQLLLLLLPVAVQWAIVKKKDPAATSTQVLVDVGIVVSLRVRGQGADLLRISTGWLYL